MRQLIGFIILISVAVVALIATVGHDVYWLIKCLKDGGDWRFYGAKVSAFGIVFLFHVAILLIVL